MREYGGDYVLCVLKLKLWLRHCLSTIAFILDIYL